MKTKTENKQDDATKASALRDCPDSTGYMLVNRLRKGGKEWKLVAIFSTSEEAKEMCDILENKDTKYTYNTQPRKAYNSKS